MTSTFRHKGTGRVVKPWNHRHRRRLERHPDWRPVDDTTDPEPEPEPAEVDPDDGVRHIGGPWFEIIVNGQVVDKVMGRQQAQQRYDTETSAW